MFIIKCTNCGREQHWTTGVNVSAAEIQIAGFTVYYNCGIVVTEEDGAILREVQIRYCHNAKTSPTEE